MARRSDLEGFSELERTFKELGRVPQTVATKSARAGGTIARRAARRNAPVDTGELRDGIIMKRERRTKQGKAVYDVMMDPAKNDIFIDNHIAGSHHSSVRRGKAVAGVDRVRSYYPASMEYGFMTVDGGYVPGYHFLKRAVTENAREIERKIIDVSTKEVEKVLRKRR